MYSRVLVPTDGSDDAEVAMDTALELVSGTDATVHVLSVLTTHHYVGDMTEAAEGMLEAGEEYVDRLAERANAAGVPVTTAIEVGRPAREILRYADDNDVDLIVISTRGKGTLENRLLGSVAEYVVTNATVPVHVVPAKR